MEIILKGVTQFTDWIKQEGRRRPGLEIFLRRCNDVMTSAKDKRTVNMTDTMCLMVLMVRGHTVTWWKHVPVTVLQPWYIQFIVLSGNVPNSICASEHEHCYQIIQQAHIAVHSLTRCLHVQNMVNRFIISSETLTDQPADSQKVLVKQTKLPFNFKRFQNISKGLIYTTDTQG